MNWKTWLVRVVLGGTGLLLIVVLSAYGWSSSRMGATWDVPVVDVTLSSDSATVERGRHIAATRGCMDCHAESFAGRVVIDVPPIGRITGTNLTAGEGGIGGRYTDADWVRAIRSGVAPDGRALLVMPSYEYRVLGPEDLGALISYLKTLPPMASEPVEQTVGPVGRALYLAGRLPLVPAEMIDHDDPSFFQPEEGVTVEYGEYLAAGCIGCHRADFSGGPFGGLPPEAPDPSNLTPDVETGLGSWTEDQFTTFLTTGVKPDGTVADRTFMPWPVTAAMTDPERRALWLFLRSLPPIRTE